MNINPLKAFAFLLLVSAVISCKHTTTPDISVSSGLNSKVVDESGNPLSGVNVHYVPMMPTNFSSAQRQKYQVMHPDDAELSSFTGQVTATGIQLNWTTASEFNNAGFEVQRMDTSVGGVWVSRGFVSGNGTTTQPHSYSFFDSVSFQSHFFYSYRLKVTNSNGQFAYSNSIAFASVQVLPSTYALYQNYPNPWTGITSISFGIAKDSYTSLKIYKLNQQDVVATLVDTVLRAGRYTISVSGSRFANGFYFYTVKSDTFEQKKLLCYSDIDAANIASQQPLATSDAGGKFAIDYSVFGVGLTTTVTNDQGAVLGTVQISDSVSVMLLKNGYKPLTQKIKLYATNAPTTLFNMQKNP